MRAPRLLPVIVLVLVVVALAWLTVAGSGQPSPPSPSATPSVTSTPSVTPTPPAPTWAPSPPPATPPAARPDDAAGDAGDAPPAEAGGDPASRTVRLTAQELSAAATQGLPDGSPVDSIELSPRRRSDGGPVLDVRAAVEGSPVALTGEIAVEVSGGRLMPRLVDARLGPFGLPEGARATIDDALVRLGDELVEPGWLIEDVAVADGVLVVRARTT